MFYDFSFLMKEKSQRERKWKINFKGQLKDPGFPYLVGHRIGRELVIVKSFMVQMA